MCQEALDSLDRHGRVDEIADAEQRTCVRPSPGDNASASGRLVISPDNLSREELNLLTHAELHRVRPCR
ncbi:MAG: hypothetical protein JWO48_39 [Bryobacterales bacterium]|nr:hypothetical protein [Bryobacterales bacterium]